MFYAQLIAMLAIMRGAGAAQQRLSLDDLCAHRLLLHTGSTQAGQDSPSSPSRQPPVQAMKLIHEFERSSCKCESYASSLDPLGPALELAQAGSSLCSERMASALAEYSASTKRRRRAMNRKGQTTSSAHPRVEAAEAAGVPPAFEPLSITDSFVWVLAQRLGELCKLRDAASHLPRVVARNVRPGQLHNLEALSKAGLYLVGVRQAPLSPEELQKRQQTHQTGLSCELLFRSSSASDELNRALASARKAFAQLRRLAANCEQPAQLWPPAQVSAQQAAAKYGERSTVAWQANKTEQEEEEEEEEKDEDEEDQVQSHYYYSYNRNYEQSIERERARYRKQLRDFGGLCRVLLATEPGHPKWVARAQVEHPAELQVDTDELTRLRDQAQLAGPSQAWQLKDALLAELRARATGVVLWQPAGAVGVLGLLGLGWLAPSSG